MECGDWGPACEIISWGFHEVAQSSNWDKLKVLAALGGLAFGIWRWWYAAERNRHTILKHYLDHEDARLASANAYVLDALERPKLKGGGAAEPLFAVAPLRKVLKQQYWHAIGSSDVVDKEVSRDLKKAIGQLDERIEVSLEVMDNLHQQLAGAHILQGAISSAIANETWVKKFRVQHDIEALESFRLALQVPGSANCLTARRLEAHQLRKLGHLTEALDAYARIEALAANLPNQRNRDLVIADARRWRAALEQSRRLNDSLQAGVGPQGIWNARYLMAQTDGGQPPGALDIRARYAPFNGWEAIDQGDMHYLTAFLNAKLGARVLARAQLDKAKGQYQTVLRSTRGFGRLASRKLWKLRQAAKLGKQRVENAGRYEQYDITWLLPPATPLDDQSNQPQQPSAQISPAAGNDGIKGAAQ